jgi:hypothetical protein
MKYLFYIIALFKCRHYFKTIEKIQYFASINQVRPHKIIFLQKCIKCGKLKKNKVS